MKYFHQHSNLRTNLKKHIVNYMITRAITLSYLSIAENK